MFIEGEDYVEIYGIEDFGGKIGRGEDDYFLERIYKEKNKLIHGRNAIDTINKAIDELEKRHVQPDTIIVFGQYFFREKELFEDPEFNIVKDSKLENRILGLKGVYKNLNVYTSFSGLMNGRVLVCDIKKAFEMLTKKNKNWFDDELEIQVIEISEDVAKRKLDQNPDKWKITFDSKNLSEEDALTVIKTSVIIDQWSYLDFRVLDTEAFEVGIINKEIKS